jgi:putative tributyrin esterase
VIIDTTVVLAKKNGATIMALITCDFYSEVLGLSSSMTVILPEETHSQIGMRGAAEKGRHRTLYLLHGLTDDHTTWHRRTSIERYVAAPGLAVVMPAVHRSYYTDMAEGYRYFTFVSEEVPAVARSFFPLSPAREDHFVAGLSMGGYGAFKMALRRPDQFAAAASLSGALDRVNALARLADGSNEQREQQNVFGDLADLAGSENDLFSLAERAAGSGGPKPRLYQWCGTEDELFDDNRRFRDHARTLGLDLTYEEGPGGHEWRHWDKMIQRVLEWLFSA